MVRLSKANYRPRLKNENQQSDLSFKSGCGTFLMMSNTMAELPNFDESAKIASSAPAKDLENNVNTGSPLKTPQEGNDVKKGDSSKRSNVHEEEGLMSDPLRSPMQTRVRRISAELRLSASSNFDNIKKAGKGLSSGLQNVANKLPLPAMPKSLRRRSWHYEEAEENNLLDPEYLTEEGGDAKPGKLKSRSSENLRKTKEEGDGDLNRGGDKSFLARKWEARKNKDQETKRESKNGKKVDNVPTEDTGTCDQGNEALSVDSIPIVFEPLTLGPRPLTPTVTVCFDEDPPKNNKNPFLD